MSMGIRIETNQSKFKIERHKIRGTVSRILKMLGCEGKEISVFFTDDETIKKLNNKYLRKNKPTNVLSFSLREGEYGDVNPQMMGDVVISVDTAYKDAVKGNMTFEQEIDFLLIHGILHLVGFNHENTSLEKAKAMRKKEKELFDKINCRNNVFI